MHIAGILVFAISKDFYPYRAVFELQIGSWGCLAFAEVKIANSIYFQHYFQNYLFKSAFRGFGVLGFWGFGAPVMEVISLVLSGSKAKFDPF